MSVKKALKTIAEQFAHDAFLPAEEPQRREQLPAFLGELGDLLGRFKLFLLWGGGNRVRCDMPHNTHVFNVTGPYKTCTNCSPAKDYCTDHTPLDHCPVCNRRI